jgi:hypothetical protein
MRFRVGDLLRNHITQEKGRVVRLVEKEKNDTVSYIVVLPASALRAEREALWRQHEVTDETAQARRRLL